MFLVVSSLGQVRVFERWGGFNRRCIGISRTTTICIDYSALERASRHRRTRLIISNRPHTIAVLSEQIRAICIDVFVQEEKVGQGCGKFHDKQVAVVAFDRCIVLATARVYLLRDDGGHCSHWRGSDSRCAIGVRDRHVLRPSCIPCWQWVSWCADVDLGPIHAFQIWVSWCADADLGPIHAFQIIAAAIDDLGLKLVHMI